VGSYGFGGHDPLDLMLGIEPPALQPEVQDEGFDPGGFGGFLENLAGFQPLAQPANFGQGFANALLGGLARKGQRVAEKRAVHEQSLLKRRASRDAANLDATRRYQDARSQRLGQVAAETRADQRFTERDTRETARRTTEDKAKYERDNPKVPDGTPKGSYLWRLADSEGRVPRATLADAIKPKDAKDDNEPLVAIDTPNGPQYVRRRAAIGHRPAKSNENVSLKPPTAGEREQLADYINTLNEINGIRESYKKEFVGPATGVVGAASARTGITAGRPAGEFGFRGRVAALRNAVLKLRSGGAVTPSEADRLLEELPITRDPSENFEAKLDNFENVIRTKAQTHRDVLNGTGIDLSKAPGLPESRKQRPPLSAFHR
jgi:hypothetical protein